jgi:5-methylthioribose kinase
VGSLDIENVDSLIAYLRAQHRIEPSESPLVRILVGGVSNKTVLVQRASGASWVLKQALPKLRVQADWFSDPARVHREANGLRWLPKLAPAGSITPLAFEDPTQHLLAMAAVPEPHENWKTMLLAGRIEEDHVIQFGRMLGEIHRRSSEMQDEVERVFRDRSFFESLRLEPYYLHTAQQIPEASRFLHDLIAHTRSRQSALVHGDYSPKNILIRQGRLILLDHEVIHWGDPAFDVGFALTHLLSKANHLPQFRERFTDSARTFWREYNSIVSDNSQDQAIRHMLGCLLARVAGRSPLEYLDASARARQQSAALSLMSETPATIEKLIDSFIDRVKR